MSKKSRKPQIRTARITERGELVLTLDGAEGRYWIDRIPSDFGVAFLLRKPVADGGVRYAVCIDDGDGQADVCECKGYLRWGKCKHCSSLRALIAAGRLPGWLRR